VSGLCTDHFINACDKLSVHVAMLFSALLIHGFAPTDMCACTVPIPKGKNVNITESGTIEAYLYVLFLLKCDVIFINKFRDYLVTSDLQFGFKKKHSTAVCSVVLKETLAYYSMDGGTAFYRAMLAQSAVMRQQVVRPSVCPSVCPSVRP